MLIRADKGIVDQLYTQQLQRLLGQQSSERNVNVSILDQLLDFTFELANAGQDGEVYGAKLLEILDAAEKAFDTPSVLPEVLEVVLTQARSGECTPWLLSAFAGDIERTG